MSISPPAWAPALMIVLASLAGAVGPALGADSRDAPPPDTAAASRRPPDTSVRTGAAAGTRADGAGPPLPLVDEAGLRRSIAAMYSAYAAQDWKKFYGLLLPLSHDLTGTLAEFEEDMKQEPGELPTSWKVVRIGPTDRGPGPADQDEFEDLEVDSAASVTMDVTYVRPDGTEYRSTDQEDLWVRMNGRWSCIPQMILPAGGW